MKRKSMRNVFLAAAAAVTAASVGFAMFFRALSCDSGTTDDACFALMDWGLERGEIFLLAGLPAIIVVILLVLAWVSARLPLQAADTQNNDR